jgi:hypothetical protein
VTATSVRYPGVTAGTTVSSRASISAFVPKTTPPALIMAPGATVQLLATVSEEPNAPILWSISDPDVATIDPSGVLRTPRCGVLGTAVVTAADALDPTVTATAALTVRYAGAGTITTLLIRDSITAQPVDVSHVGGTIAIRLGLDDRLVECGGVSRVDVVVRSTGRDDIVLVAKLPTFPETSVDVYFNTTARFANDQPRTPNGSYSIVARVFDPKAQLFEATAPIPVVFDNP